MKNTIIFNFFSFLLVISPFFICAQNTEKNNLPVPSRTMTVKKNQMIDAAYPGMGWIYQGNIDEYGIHDIENNNFMFGGRKLNGDYQSFLIRAKKAGKFFLHFYKIDILSGNYTDDYLEVIVENENSQLTSRISAPSYAEAVPPKITITSKSTAPEKIEDHAHDNIEVSLLDSAEKIEENSEIQKNDFQIDPEMKTVIQQSSGQDELYEEKSVFSENSSKALNNNKSASNKELEDSVEEQELTAEELLNDAKAKYENKEYAAALKLITDFFEKAVMRIDEGLYLQGQILEEKSAVQNIKNAVDSYELIIKNYPYSILKEPAGKKLIFLKRFYINIR